MRLASALALTLLLAASASAQQLVSAFPSLTFSSPVDIQAADDGSNRLFVVEQAGRIRVFPNSAGAAASSVFLDIDPLVTSGGELGLLGLVFDPGYAQNGYFYVNYTAASPLRTVIARYTVSAGNPNVADPGSALILLQVNQPFSNHNAGQLQFGPPEGPGGERYLYVGFGDGGSGGDPFENGQNTNTLLGDMLRLDVDGGGLPLDCGAGSGAATVPADNPFVGQAGYCDEIWASGLRNPWRYSFDLSGRLWIADVGQGAWEEIDVPEAGDNLGWNKYEGNHCYDGPCDPAGFEFPIHEYPHQFNTSGGYAVIGGYVYDGPNCAGLRDLYVYGDNVTGNIWTLDYDGTTATNSLLLGLTGRSISSFGLDEQGDLFLADLGGGGRLYRFNCPRDVAVTAAPVDAPVVIGPGGGVFDFDVTLTNTTGQAQTFDVWADADLSTGAEFAAVLGPQTITLAAGADLERRVRVRVPGSAPAGTSTLVVKVGTFPDAPESSDRFTVTKQAAAEAVAEAPTAEAWTAGWSDAPEETAAPAPEASFAQAVRLDVVPNPFDAQTTVRFDLPVAAPVRVEVLDLLGRRVALLADGPLEAGRHAVTWDGGGAPAGVYLVRMTMGATTRTHRVTVVR